MKEAEFWKLAYDRQHAENEQLRARVAVLSRVLNGLANREDFADKVLEAADKTRTLVGKE